MNRTSVVLFFLFINNIVFPQSPQALNYQAVARNSNGLILPAQNIKVQFSILDGSVTGTAVYQETHTTVTNNFGLFTLSIGRGTLVNGTFSGINWSSGEKFLKVEISPTGDNNYLLQGTAQLLSVPYALYAEKTNLVAGNAINITGGNTIAANYQAGTGINIAGNMISSTVTNPWLAAPNGIKYTAGKVGIGMDPHPIVPLSIFMPNTNNGNAVLHLKSDDIWHTGLTMFNGNNHYTMVIGGPSNNTISQANFGLLNHQTLTYSFIANGTNNFFGIGPNYGQGNASSRLHVFNGDINIDQIGSGIIMKSPNGQCWRVTIDNAGNLVRTAIACP